ncbi:MAG: DUF2510 domain-containing protein [Ilumatobacteraceae bacterium]
MRLADAPRPGWYPDPVGGVRLRWWDGTDWTDEYRSRPSVGQLLLANDAAQQARLAARVTDPRPPSSPGGLSRTDTEEIISQVRQAARSEAERAAELFSQRARTATREIQPLITEYTNKILRWLRIGAVIVIVLLVGWILFQVIAQVSFFEWLGDRIDNLTEN